MRFYKKDKYIAVITYKNRKIFIITQYEIDELRKNKRLFKDIIKFQIKKILDVNKSIKYILICGKNYSTKFLITDKKERLINWLTPTLFGSFNHIDIGKVQNLIK